MDQISSLPSSPQPSDIVEHEDVAAGYRYPNVSFRGVEWSFGHLEPFPFHQELKSGFEVVVVVLFSTHCFTHRIDRDDRAVIPQAELYRDGNEVRVLSEQRYRLSKLFFPGFVEHLRNHQIRVLGGPLTNYATFTALDSDGKEVQYAVFFVVIKDSKRKGRLLLKVQSAYVLDTWTKKLQKAGKVRLPVLLRAAYEGRPIAR